MCLALTPEEVSSWTTSEESSPLCRVQENAREIPGIFSCRSETDDLSSCKCVACPNQLRLLNLWIMIGFLSPSCRATCTSHRLATSFDRTKRMDLIVDHKDVRGNECKARVFGEVSHRSRRMRKHEGRLIGLADMTHRSRGVRDDTGGLIYRQKAQSRPGAWWAGRCARLRLA